ncbi:MAG: hypothetical protein ACREFL_15745 [Stellaceae bacterium]
MLTPAEWNKQSLCFQKMAKDEPDPHLRGRLVQHAHALAKLAMKIERDEARRERSLGKLSGKSRIAERVSAVTG